MRHIGSPWCVGSLLVVLAVGGASASEDESEFDVQRGVAYGTSSDRPLLADVYIPQSKGPHPGVLVVHGGAWMSGTRSQLTGVAQCLARRNYTAVAIGYRLAPAYKFPAQLADCKAAVRWMRREADRLKIDAARIGGYGYSAGGHLVALLGTSGDAASGDGDESGEVPSASLQAVVAGGAPCDFTWIDAKSNLLTYWLGGSRREKPETYRRASPIHFASEDDPPVFFFHGSEDRLVPLSSPQRLKSRLETLGVATEMYVIDDASHLGAFFNQQATLRACQFLDQHLRKTASPASWVPHHAQGTDHECRP